MTGHMSYVSENSGTGLLETLPDHVNSCADYMRELDLMALRTC
jgi:hypothetical protein